MNPFFISKSSDKNTHSEMKTEKEEQKQKLFGERNQQDIRRLKQHQKGALLQDDLLCLGAEKCS